ncbi:MAG TPA: F0F1 ATP synthase subunit B [Pseudonocardiaceae bacterium]|jgi:F-type H+-transporting ATPase subunit b|nr:F0F1 ATP synthase subunit B [Pseudonocardiaceae bacterium]
MNTSILAAAPANPLLPNGTFFVELIIFVIVLVVMWRFIVPPILRAMQERADRVQKTADERQEATEKLAAAEQRYDEALAEARKEAGGIRLEARTEGQHVLDELRGQAQQEVDGVRRRGEEELAEQRERALRELQGHIGELSVSLASKVVGADLSAGERSATTVAQFLDGLTAKGDA